MKGDGGVAARIGAGPFFDPVLYLSPFHGPELARVAH